MSRILESESHWAGRCAQVTASLPSISEGGRCPPPPRKHVYQTGTCWAPSRRKGSSLREAVSSLVKERMSTRFLVESPCLLEIPQGVKLCSNRTSKASRLSGPPPSAPWHTGCLVDLVVASHPFCATELQGDLRQDPRPPSLSLGAHLENRASGRSPQNRACQCGLPITWLGPVPLLTLAPASA